MTDLFRQIAEEEDAIRARSNAREELRRRITSLELPPRREKPRARAWVGALVAAAAALVLGVVFFTYPRPDVLEVRVGKSSAPPLIGAWLGAPDDERLPLSFSDGTRLELAPKSKARLREVRAEGARVELAQGTLHVNVVHRTSTDFWIHAGPFTVHVTGTRFDVRFDPKDESFTLALAEGHVELSGCVFGTGRPLAAGQTVYASCRKRTLDVRYGDRLEPAPQAQAPQNQSPVPERSRAGAAEVRAPAVSGTSARTEPTRTEPIRGTQREPGAAELAEQADVLRHAGAYRDAKQALLTLRRRFPGTDEAALAAFTLGRMEFDGRGSRGGAIFWFQTYLKERPRGAMTREALGRLIEAFQAEQDLLAARAVASRYLHEYPSGPHAELASRVLSTP